MKHPTARAWLFCLCALPWLAACGAKSHTLTRPQVIEVPVEVYAPLDRSLTAPLPPPAPPPARCHQRDGAPAVCVSDALGWIEVWRGLLQRANADRAAAARITAAPGKGQRDDR